MDAISSLTPIDTIHHAASKSFNRDRAEQVRLLATPQREENATSQSIEMAGSAIPSSAVTDDPGQVPQRVVARAVGNINDFLQHVRRELRFTIDDDTGRTVIQVVDQSTKEIIRQIPSQAVLKLAAGLEEFSGLLFKEQA
jgi:flagellar protein FlaG